MFADEAGDCRRGRTADLCISCVCLMSWGKRMVCVVHVNNRYGKSAQRKSCGEAEKMADL